MIDPAWFAGRLRELREARGLTQEQLAAAAHMARIGIAQLEGNDRWPAWQTVIALCEALGVTPNDFIVEPTKRLAATAGEAKRPRGRPRQAAQVADEPAPPQTAASDAAADPAPKKPGRGGQKGKKAGAKARSPRGRQA